MMLIYNNSGSNHAYIFMILMLIICYGVSLSSTSLLSESLQLVSINFGSATALNDFFKFSLAGFANFIMSFSTGHKLLSNLPIQQLIIILITIATLYIVKFTKEPNN